MAINVGEDLAVLRTEVAALRRMVEAIALQVAPDAVPAGTTVPEPVSEPVPAPADGGAMVPTSAAESAEPVTTPASAVIEEQSTA
ncbi:MULTISPECIES: hypothetical protein [Rhodococcus]|uniref:hypothetical protein n=1 Tax=Rhodococcus TaxID=1827 RepID=UPI000C7CF76B|nr:MULTISPECIES: hypothetical protein [Rhodococcus]AUM18217.1 hypothetical protein CSW53_17810 [Rhodococcus ruber]